MCDASLANTRSSPFHFPPNQYRAEQVFRRRKLQEPFDDHLRLGTERDNPVAIAPTVLVVVRPVKPNIASRVDVAGPQNDNLARAHCGELLELHHRGNLLRHVRQCLLHPHHRHRLDGLGFAGFSAAITKSSDGPEGLVHSRQCELLADGPAEHSLDPIDPVIYHTAREFLLLDHVLPDGL
jgi:hypothetical protein